MACTRLQQWAFGDGGLRDIWAQLPEQGQALFRLLKGASDLLLMPKDVRGLGLAGLDSTLSTGFRPAPAPAPAPAAAPRPTTPTAAAETTTQAQTPNPKPYTLKPEP
jgi:hypothetical protein